MIAPVRIDEVLTLGVEEEFLLADVHSRVAVARAGEVVEKARILLDDRAQHELYATQVEFATVPHQSLDGLRADLVRSRTIGATAAASTGSLLVASASAILTERPIPVVASDSRYAEMARRFRAVAEGVESESSGCHVHLGTLDRDEALELGNHLRPWLPALQAICVNSPIAAGRDRRCASWRHFEVRAWPTTGPAPSLDGAEYERVVTALVETGTIMDRGMVYWYARPSEHCPTLEIRCADVNPSLDAVLLYAALLRGLGTTLLAEIRQGRPAPHVSQTALAKAHQDVALAGLAGTALDPVLGVPTPVVDQVQAIFERGLPGLKAAGDGDAADRLMTRVTSRGTAADRQRAVYRRRRHLRDVVDSLAVRTTDR